MFGFQSCQLLLFDKLSTKSASAKKGSSNLERRFDRRNFEVSAPHKPRNQDVVGDCQASQRHVTRNVYRHSEASIAIMSKEVAQSRRTASAALRAMSAMSENEKHYQVGTFMSHSSIQQTSEYVATNEKKCEESGLFG